MRGLNSFNQLRRSVVLSERSAKLYVDDLNLLHKGTHTVCISVNTFMTVKMNSHPRHVMQEFQNEQQNFSRLAKTSRTMQTARSMVEKKSIDEVYNETVYWQLLATISNCPEYSVFLQNNSQKM